MTSIITLNCFSTWNHRNEWTLIPLPAQSESLSSEGQDQKKQREYEGREGLRRRNCGSLTWEFSGVLMIISRCITYRNFLDGTENSVVERTRQEGVKQLKKHVSGRTVCQATLPTFSSTCRFIKIVAIKKPRTGWWQSNAHGLMIHGHFAARTYCIAQEAWCSAGTTRRALSLVESDWNHVSRGITRRQGLMSQGREGFRKHRDVLLPTGEFWGELAGDRSRRHPLRDPVGPLFQIVTSRWFWTCGKVILLELDVLSRYPAGTGRFVKLDF